MDYQTPPVATGQFNQPVAALPVTNQAFTESNAVSIERSWQVKLLSAVFLVLSGLTFYNFIASLAVFIILSSSFASIPGALDYETLLIFPLYPLLPLVFLLTAVFYLVSGLKLRDSSKRSWNLAVAGLIAGLITTFLVIVSVFNQALLSGELLQDLPLQFLKSRWLMPLILIILFLTPRSKFNGETEPLKSRAKLGIGLIFGLVLLLITGYFANGYRMAYLTDYGYGEVAETASFHIYRPAVIPGGRQQTLKYHWNETETLIAGKKEHVLSAYQFSWRDIAITKKVHVIQMRQLGVKPGYDFEGFVNESTNDKEVVISDLEIDNPVIAKAMVLTRKLSSTNLVILNLLTKDNVLVILYNLNGDITELKQMAESLY